MVHAMSLLGLLHRRRAVRALRLERRRPGPQGLRPATGAPRWCVPWWEGTVAGNPVALCGEFGLSGFRGELVVGRYEYSGRLSLERRRRRGPLAHQTFGDRTVPSPMLPVILDAGARLSPAVRRLEVASAGSRAADWGPARTERLVADATVLAELVEALARLTDQPLLAAVKADDLVAVRERLAAGDDPREAGPRDREFPAELGTRPERPLLVALAEGRLEIARELLAAGALRGADPWLALTLAVRLGDRDMLEALLVHGGVVPERIGLDSALAEALRLGWTEGVSRLLRAGADPDRVEPPRGPGSAELRALLAQARARRVETGGPLAVTAEREGSLAGAATRWRDRVVALIPIVWPRVRRAWLEAASDLGLRRVPGPPPGTLVGDLDGLPVRVEVTRVGPTVVTRITVEGTPPWLALRRETLREKLGLTGERFMEPTAASQWRKTNDVVVGDHTFDDRVDVKGPASDCLPLLSHSVRRQVAAFIDGLGGTVEGGLARLDRSGIVDDQHRLVLLVRATRQMVSALAAQADRGPLAGLADIARGDPLERVRATMLGALGGRFPTAPETVEAARLAITEGRWDWYRMAGASLLGEEGTAFYRATLADPSQSPGVRGMALRHLGFRLGSEAEELILSHLGAPEREIVLHAVRVLGERAGTARSVAPLQAMAGPIPVTEVARAAARAVEAIQSRRVHAAPGQVSLVGADREGELALAPPAPAQEGGNMV